MSRRAEDDYVDYIGRKVYDLTWQGKLWGRGGAIAWSRKRYWHFRNLGKRAEAASSLSSTYYTAAGNAFALAKQLPMVRRTIWLLRGVWYLFWALAHSNEVERILGVKNMTHGQLDIRASILAKCRKYARAQRYLQAALRRQDITDDSRALVLVKLGEVYQALGRPYPAEESYSQAAKMEGLKATTKVRVLKSLGQYYRRVGGKGRAQEYLQKALALAEKNNLGDQIMKIKALLKK